MRDRILKNIRILNLFTKHILEVSTSDVKAARKNSILHSNGIGSCVAIAAYDSDNKIGGLAHVMLPGVAPIETIGKKTKYAKNAIDELFTRMIALGGKREKITTSLVGGGNVLKREGDNTGNNNVSYIIDILREKDIVIVAKAVGGFERRTITFDVGEGEVNFTEGNSKEQLLWKYNQK